MFECAAKEGSFEFELNFEFCVWKAILTFLSVIGVHNTSFYIIENTVRLY
jgi:hypothetical protein